MGWRQHQALATSTNDLSRQADEAYRIEISDFFSWIDLVNPVERVADLTGMLPSDLIHDRMIAVLLVQA